MKRRLDEVARFTSQPRAVAEFYAKLFDRPTPASQDGEEAFNYKLDDVNFFIHPTDGSPPTPGWPADVDHIAFEVDDLDVECDRLREAGLEVHGPADFPWGRIAWVNDPDGRQVELHGPGIAYDGA